jgi:hypothetical protein
MLDYKNVNIHFLQIQTIDFIKGSSFRVKIRTGLI